MPAWVHTCRLRPPVQRELERLYASGVLRPGGPDLDPATMEHLRPLPEEAGVSALRELACLDFQRLWNLSAFFVGICRSRGAALGPPRARRRSRSPPLRTAGPPPWMESPPGRGPGSARGRSPPGRARSPLSPLQRGLGRPGALSPLPGGGYRGGSPPGRGGGRASSSPAGPRRERFGAEPPPALLRPGSPGYGYAPAAGGHGRGGRSRSPPRALPGPPGRPGAEPLHQQASPVSPVDSGGGYQQQRYDAWGAEHQLQHRQHQQQHHQYQQQHPLADYPAARSPARYGSPLSGGDPPTDTAYAGVRITSLAAWDAPALPAAAPAGGGEQHQQPGRDDAWYPQHHQHHHQHHHQPEPGHEAHGYAGSGYAAAPAAAGGYSPGAAGMFDVQLSSLDQWAPGSVVRGAVTDYVKELLKPAWKAQRISREAYKSVAKRSVEKVLCSVALAGPHALPDSAEGAAQLLSERTRAGMQNLVEAFVALAEQHGIEARLAAA